MCTIMIYDLQFFSKCELTEVLCRWFCLLAGFGLFVLSIPPSCNCNRLCMGEW